MFTDIVGYTALSQRDERLALDLMEEHAQLLRELFRHYGGREVKALGDGFLVEFPSTLQAVECAVEIQQAERNTKLPPQMYLQVRIGRHVGDVVRREGDVFGDAVNIASRLQALAEPGGICLSGQVYAQIGNKLGLKHVSLGRKRLKNVRVAVEVYRIVVGEEVRRPPARTGEKWRIAVLPLANSVPIPLTNSSPRG
jgi:class 3 adenylate cyclase